MKNIKEFVNKNQNTIKKVLIGAGTATVISLMIVFGLRRHAIKKYGLEEVISAE